MKIEAIYPFEILSFFHIAWCRIQKGSALKYASWNTLHLGTKKILNLFVAIISRDKYYKKVKLSLYRTMEAHGL
jgi:hypothetical protein